MNYSFLLNSNFRCRIYGNGINTLVGWSGLKSHLGLSLAKSALLAALNSSTYKYTFRLRRGLKIDFYAK